MFSGDLSFEIVLPLIGAAFTASFGLYVWAKAPRSMLNVLFLAFSAAISLWLYGTFQMFINRYDPEAAVFWDRFVYIGVVFVPSLMHHFSLVVTKNIGQRKLLALNYLYSLFFLGLSWTPYFVDGLNVFPRLVHSRAMIGHHIFLLIFFIAASMMFVNLYNFYKKTKDQSLRHATVITGTAFLNILLIGGTAYLPAYGIDIGYPFSYFSGIIFVVLLSISITKFQLLSTRIMVAEMFVFITSLLFFSYVISLKDVGEIIFGIIVFSLFLYFGMSMVRAMSKEIAQREKVQALMNDLAQANDKLKELDAMKSEFVSVASHQLRTPLSVIKGYLSLIDEGAYGKVVPKMGRIHHHIFEMNERMIGMVNNLLNISRIERNKISYTCTTIDIGAITREIVRNMKLGQKKKIDIHIGIIEKLNKPCYADPEKVREVLGNMIDNAIKYTTEGEVEVSIRHAPKNDEVMVTVRDTGMGMSPEDIKNVFTKFFRAKNTEHQTGTGIGLFVCERFVRAMGGKIWVEASAPGKGTTMAFTLPTSAKSDCVESEQLA